MEVIRDIDLLISSVGEIIARSKSPAIVSVSGYPGSGKSTVSEKLSERLSIKHINLDMYLPPQADSRISWLGHVVAKLPEIQADLTEGESNVLDGVMANCVAQKIANGTSIIISVYVKKLDKKYGLWNDGANFLDSYMYASNLKRPKFLSSVDEFHESERPDLNSDFVLELTHEPA